MKKKIGFISLLNIIYSALLVSISFISRELIDKATLSKTQEVLIIGAILVGVIILQILIKIVSQALYYRVSVKYELALKKSFFADVEKKKTADLSKYHSGEIINLFTNDTRNIVDFETNVIPTTCQQISRFCFALVALIIMSVDFFLVLLGVGVIAFIFAKVYIKKVKTYQRKTSESDGVIQSYAQESVENIKIIKSYNAIENSLKHFDSLASENALIKGKKNRLLLFGNSGVNAIFNLSYIFALIYGGYAISKEMITYGTVVALLQLVNHFESPFITLSSSLSKYGMYLSSKERIKKVSNLENEEEAISITSFDKIVFDNVTFSYDKLIHKNLSFEVNKGEKVLLKGPSGTGKTTLFMLLLGFITPDSGSIYIVKDNGKINVSEKTRSLFSYVPQENILFSGTIIENINLLTNSTKEEIINALKQAQIYDEIMAMPKKLDTVLKERGSGLSLGQIQRILIAISILKNNPVMLLDEFSSALDRTNEKEIITNLSTLNKTIIYITHRDMNLDDCIIQNLAPIEE